MRIAERLTIGRTLTDENMIFLRQLGIHDLMVTVSSLGGEVHGTSDASRLTAGQYWDESSGLRLFGLAHTPYHRYDRIIRGLPGRDEQIDHWCKSLRAMGAAGIPLLQYNWVINAGATWPNWRTSVTTPGRGGALMSSFNFELAKDMPTADIGPLTDEEMWNNLTYFLQAVIPVAEQAGVTMALHPADPQVPMLAGIARIIRSVDAYQRVFDMMPSDSNTMVFCQGCFAQMLDADGVYEAIRYFGSRNKISYIHFRNVTGTLEKFEETYWDEGKVDMLKAFKAYKEVGFEGCLVPDHTPHGIGDTAWGHRGRAFAIGYMKGLLQAVSGSA
jgi:mannonate dehydratase